jgi:uncharacterized protein (DUF58 family)
LAVTAAASLAHAVATLGQQVGLMTNGRDAADRVREEGTRHRRHDDQEFSYRSRREARQQTEMREEPGERLRPLRVETRRGIEQFQRIREVLARVELTDGLTFPQLVLEVSPRLPRDASVIAVLPAVPSEAALALGQLRRQGFAVSAILVMLGENELADGYGRLAAEGIRDVRPLPSESALPDLCNSQVNRTPYSLSLT